MLSHEDAKCVNFSAPSQEIIESLQGSVQSLDRQLEHLNGILTLAHRVASQETQSLDGCRYSGDLFAVLASLDSMVHQTNALIEFVDEEFRAPIWRLSDNAKSV